MKARDINKNYQLVNGLGTITFSAALMEKTIKQALVEYPHYQYVSHSINSFDNDYLEISVTIKTPSKFSLKVIDRLQKDLLIVLKQSLSLTCVLAINIDYEK